MSILEWTDVAAVDEVSMGDVIGRVIDGREIAIFNADGEFFATDNLCTHGRARLCGGFVEGHEIECPLHQARFDIRTGQPSCGPATQALRCHPVKTKNGRIHIALG